MSKKIKIVGPTVKTIWGREVDLNQVPESSIPQFDGYEFLYLKFKRMSDFMENPNSSKSLSNVGVRANNEKDEDAVVALYSDYVRDGVDLNYPVPTMTEDGTLIDGRGRTHAHIDYDQEWMVFGVYRPTVNLQEERRVLKTAGLVANIRKRPARGNSLNDYISCGISLQSQGDLGDTDTEIEEWLCEAKFFEDFPSAIDKTNGLVTRVKNAIRKKTVSNINVMKVGEVIEWCNNPSRTGFPNVDSKSVVILNTKSSDYLLRLLKQFQREYSLWRTMEIILWTTQSDYNKAKSDMNNVQKELENEWIERNRMLGQSTAKGEIRPIPWTVLGCVPQFEDEGQDLNSIELISPEDY